MKKILLDTNAYTYLMSGDKKVLSALSIADVVYISIFVLGELYAGFKGGTKESQNIEVLMRFLQKPTVSVLTATQETSKTFGQVKHHLKKAGTPIPINDVWIAAHAIETSAYLVSFDTHFHQINDLKIWNFQQI